MSPNKLISREEVLEGLRGKPAKQASTLLTLIENRTAHLVAQSQPHIGLILAETTLAERSRAYLDAIAAGREPSVPPTIQQLERFAPQWTLLVPDNPSVRATVAYLLGQKYVFTAKTAPGIRAALGLDTPMVRDAFQSLYQTPLESVFATQLTWAERWRWTWANLSHRIESLPPFWLACIFTVVIGAVTLALPIAVAGVGPLPGVIVIIVIGLINMLTIAAMSETVTRSGSIRYGSAFIGRVVADYLGNTSSALLSIVLAAFSFGLLLVFYLGISTTLEGASNLPAEAWMVLIFLIGLYFLTRGSLNATLALSIIINLVNFVLLLTLSLLAFTHLRLENLLYINVPFLNGQPFAPETLSFLIGVVMGIFSSHILVVIFGKLLLQRDPGGQAVLKGHTAGIGIAIIVNIIWVLAASGAVAPQVLAGQAGTSLVSLTAEIGPAMGVLGAIFVIVSMGLGMVQFSVALFNLAHERLDSSTLGSSSRFLLSLSPVIAVFLLAEWLSFSGTASFTGILALLGVIVDSLMTAIFPVLLLVASRRKGDVLPGAVYQFLGHPALATLIYLLALGNLFFHGLIVWQNPVQRIVGIGVGLLMLGITLMMFRRGAFASRLVVEVRQEERQGQRSRFNLIGQGQPLIADVRLTYPHHQQHLQTASAEVPNFSDLQSITVQLPATPARQLKLWVHRMTPAGDSEGLAATVTMQTGSDKQELNLVEGQALLPVPGEAYQVEIRLAKSR